MVMRRCSRCTRVAEGRLGQIQIDPAVLQHAHSLDLGDGPFQLARVVLDLGGDVAEHVFGQRQAAHARLFLKDGDAGFVARLFDPRDQAPVEPAHQPFLQFGDFAGGAVGREDDLLVLLIERVERVKKFFLRAIAAGQEMDVVDHQQIDVAIAMAELMHVAVLDRQDELVDERIAGEIQDPRVGLLLEHLLADGLKQMRFAKTDAAMDEQRVVRLAGLLGDGHRRGVGKTIARAGYEMFENVIRIEREWLVSFIEHAAARQVVAVKAH